MSDPPGRALYSREFLALAVELAAYPFDADAPLLGEARSRSCGSIVQLSCETELAGLGLKVQACAVGQASAAIFARHAAGRSRESLNAALGEIEAWLEGAGDVPGWPDIDKLEPARAYPGRHGAVVLPWRAALDALSKQGTSR